MFEMVKPLSASRSIEIAHIAIAIFRHMKDLPSDERKELAYARAKLTRDTETDLALAVIEEIERVEGALLAQLDDDAVNRHLTELADLAMSAGPTPLRHYPQRGRARLEEMRRAAAF